MESPLEANSARFSIKRNQYAMGTDGVERLQRWR
jgi:hypothetical protein